MKLNFDILPLDNLKTLVVTDTTEGWEISDVAEIKIKTPSTNVETTHLYSKTCNNNFNSISLGLNCLEDGCTTELPDGIYTITLVSGEEKVVKHYLRLNKIELELDKKIVAYDINGCGCDSPAIDVEMLLKSAKANVRFGNINRANEDYNKAKKILGCLTTLC